MYKNRAQKRPILQLSKKIKRIVEERIVERHTCFGRDPWLTERADFSHILTVNEKEREEERERDRERERKKQRQRDRETERQRDRERENDTSYIPTVKERTSDLKK